MKVYKILNPTTGEYVDAITPEECLDSIATIALDLYLKYTDQNLFSIADIDEGTGAETWTTANGENMLSPSQMQNAMRLKVSQAAPQILPVSYLGE